MVRECNRLLKLRLSDVKHPDWMRLRYMSGYRAARGMRDYEKWVGYPQWLGL